MGGGFAVFFNPANPLRPIRSLSQAVSLVGMFYLPGRLVMFKVSVSIAIAAITALLVMPAQMLSAKTAPNAVAHAKTVQPTNMVKGLISADAIANHPSIDAAAKNVKKTSAANKKSSHIATSKKKGTPTKLKTTAKKPTLTSAKSKSAKTLKSAHKPVAKLTARKPTSAKPMAKIGAKASAKPTVMSSHPQVKITHIPPTIDGTHI
jgi:hypothetical protein